MAFLNGFNGRRRLHHSGQHGGLVEREILRLLPEIVAGRPVEAHDIASAELDLVEIGRQERVLAHRAVERAGVPQFGALPLDPAEHVALLQVVEDEVLQQLHRDGASPAVEAAPKHGEQGDDVDAAVIEIALVLDRGDRRFHDRRDFVGPEHDRAAAIGIEPVLGARDHHLRRSDEDAEMVRLQVPERIVSAAFAGTSDSGTATAIATAAFSERAMLWS